MKKDVIVKCGREVIFSTLTSKERGMARSFKMWVKRSKKIQRRSRIDLERSRKDPEEIGKRSMNEIH